MEQGRVTVIVHCTVHKKYLILLRVYAFCTYEFTCSMAFRVLFPCSHYRYISGDKVYLVGVLDRLTK